jgi:hypothetical protein
MTCASSALHQWGGETLSLPHHLLLPLAARGTGQSWIRPLQWDCAWALPAAKRRVDAGKSYTPLIAVLLARAAISFQACVSGGPGPLERAYRFFFFFVRISFRSFFILFLFFHFYFYVSVFCIYLYYIFYNLKFKNCLEIKKCSKYEKFQNLKMFKMWKLFKIWKLFEIWKKFKMWKNIIFKKCSNFKKYSDYTKFQILKNV